MKPIRHRIRQNGCTQTGFTLIEYLISLSIGLAVLSALCGVVQGFLSMQAKINNRTRWWYQSVTAEQQITASVHLAGFAGCVRPPDWQNPLTVNADRNELTVLHASQKNAVLISSQLSPPILLISHALIFKPGDFFLINNCICSEQGMVIAVAPAGKGLQKIVPDHALKCVTAAAEVYRVEKDRFFLAMNKKKGTKTLFMQNARHESTMLAENVTEFRVDHAGTKRHIRGITVHFRMAGSGQSKAWKFFVSPRN